MFDWKLVVLQASWNLFGSFKLFNLIQKLNPFLIMNSIKLIFLKDAAFGKMEAKRHSKLDTCKFKISMSFEAWTLS